VAGLSETSKPRRRHARIVTHKYGDAAGIGAGTKAAAQLMASNGEGAWFTYLLPIADDVFYSRNAEGDERGATLLRHLAAQFVTSSGWGFRRRRRAFAQPACL
jgi:hypothetical protein